MPVELVDWVGKRVKVVNATYGWGIGDSKIMVDDVGIVVSVGDNTLIVDIEGKGDFKGIKGCIFAKDDLVLLDDSSIKPDKVALDYIDFCRQRIKIIEDKKFRVLKDIRVAQDNLYKWVGDVANYNTLIKSAKTKHASMSVDKVCNTFATLEGMFSNIRYVDSCIIAVTNPITLKFKDSCDIVSIDMGVYEITLDIVEGITFRYVSGGYKSVTRSSYIHPHVMSNGDACWGSWHKTLEGLHAESNYIAELRLAYEFLCSAEPSGWYISAYAFAKDNGKRCEDCWLLTDDCECHKCDGCGNHIDNCDCIRCPDSGDRIEEIGEEYCGDCSSLDEDGHCNY